MTSAAPIFPLISLAGCSYSIWRFQFRLRYANQPPHFDKGCFTNLTEGLKPSKNFL